MTDTVREQMEKVLLKYKGNTSVLSVAVYSGVWSALVNDLCALVRPEPSLDDLDTVLPQLAWVRGETLTHQVCVRCNHCLDCPACAPRPEGR